LAIFEDIIAFFAWFNGILGSATQAVWLPVFLFIIAIIFRAKPGKAFRAAITIGVGWIGLQVVIGLFFGGYGGAAIPAAAAAMRDRFHLALTAIDVGWPPMAAIAFGSIVGVLMIPIGIIVNLLLLGPKLTKTFDIDIWNFWHWAFVGGTLYTLTTDLAFSIFAAITYEVFCLKVADWTVKPLWDLFPGYKNYSIPQGGGWVGSIPFIAVFKPIIDRIPSPKTDPETLREKAGVLGEPTIIGLIVGAVIGLLAGYGLLQIVLLAMISAAVMLLLPRVIGILMEGLTGIADPITEYMHKRFKEREIYIGMDAAIAIGHPTTVASALILIPIVLFWAAVIPGITVLPFFDLASTPFFVVAAVPFFKGDLFKSTVMGAIIMLLWQLMGSWWAPVLTETAKLVGWAMPSGTTQIGSLWLQPMIVPAYLSYLLSQTVPGAGYIVLVIIIIITLFADRSKALVRLFSKLYS
jgi:PTS system galactitol-specific IIC component